MKGWGGEVTWDALSHWISTSLTAFTSTDPAVVSSVRCMGRDLRDAIDVHR
ncbi:hypothetical protein [Ornithinimicrobium sp. LYQ103]|uniref:hypothetical protein n=1 Tax=Ornithinimicrobium sp. LYQ103 TaxID=3378796 RepID=UPI0038518448